MYYNTDWLDSQKLNEGYGGLFYFSLLLPSLSLSFSGSVELSLRATLGARTATKLMRALTIVLNGRRREIERERKMVKVSKSCNEE